MCSSFHTSGSGNIQGGGWKFLGHFKHHSGVTNIIKIDQACSYLANKGKILTKVNYIKSVKQDLE